MIASLRGKLIHKNNTEVILDVNGIGYSLLLSKRSSEMLTEMNSEYSLITHLDVKENSLQLYGFFDEKEKEIFKLLLTVSGIGPKMAHTILSHTTFEEIINIINNSSSASIIKIPGIGSKKMELISMTLKDKIFRIDRDMSDKFKEAAGSGTSETARLEALTALMNLGYVRSEAEKIIREVLKSLQTDEQRSITTEEIIRRSLNYISN
jgi:holliday junction DNA helicase RuvA